jgi:hypothetical protein
MFESLVPIITHYLEKHHELYSGQCKAEYWEELLSKALKDAGFGSNWKPDSNHKSGVDQTTDDGLRISNKSGSIRNDVVNISGSRLTEHKTLQDKLNFLSVKKEDYILCLSTDKKEWERGNKFYYFIVIDSDKLNYHEQEWKEKFGQRDYNREKVVGWKCICENYSADINISMSDQLWTDVKLDICEEIYDIVIR